MGEGRGRTGKKERERGGRVREERENMNDPDLRLCLRLSDLYPLVVFP